PVALSFDANLTQLAGDKALIRFPDRLEAGWYVAEITGERPAQAVVQVTAISAWSAGLSDRTVVWGNDGANHAAVAGAGVRVEGGAAIGKTDGRGLVNAPTPDAIIPPTEGAATVAGSNLLRVTAPSGAAVFVPFDRSGPEHEDLGGYDKASGADTTYWS